MSDARTHTVDARRREPLEGGLALEVVAPDGPPPTPLGAGSTIVGRGDDVDLKVLGEGVSRRHVKLVHRGGSEVQIIDLGSHNGTFVNGARVEVGEVSVGDEILVGSVTLRLLPCAGDPGEAPRVEPVVAKVLRPRELEVARLVAQGMTNAQVGAQLHISARTVGRHLANIYERLQIHSRAALAKSIGELDAHGDSGT